MRIQCLLVAMPLMLICAACSSRDERAASQHADSSITPTPVHPPGDSIHVTENSGNDVRADQRVVLTEAGARAAGIRVEPVRLDSSAGRQDLQMPGQVDFDPRRVAVISPRVAGRIERLEVVEGETVVGGQVVAQISSPAYLTAQNDFAQARRRATSLAGGPDADGARLIAEAARRRLAMMGGGPAAVARLEDGIEMDPYLALEAPFGGTIMDARALPGQAVEAGHEIFRLADLSVVDVVADIPEQALPLVHVGQAATISIPAYPHLEFAGHVERLRSELNPETRTVRAVIHARNPAGRLRPGMFATVRLAVTPGRGGTAAVVIPEAAVITDGEQRFVFVEVAPLTFVRRPVEILPLASPGAAVPGSDRVIVRSGLAPGERVVVAGAFTLKSELAKGAFGEDD